MCTFDAQTRSLQPSLDGCKPADGTRPRWRPFGKRQTVQRNRMDLPPKNRKTTPCSSFPKVHRWATCYPSAQKSVRRAECRWNPIKHVETRVPETVTVNELAALRQIQAQLVYSDGSVRSKTVQWEIKPDDRLGTEGLTIEGTIHENAYSFPLAVGYGDPVIFFWEGNWYFIATNDNEDDRAFYVRKADCVEGFSKRTRRRRFSWMWTKKRGLYRLFGHRNFM